MRSVYRFLLILHIFVGLGAMAGGLGAILDPYNPMGASAEEILKNAPFTNFLIPGIILFTVLGLGNIASGITLGLKSKYQGYISSVFSWALVIWIIVQCYMIGDVVFLHVLFFLIGCIQAALSTWILFDQKLFPTNIILGFYAKMKKEL